MLFSRGVQLGETLETLHRKLRWRGECCLMRFRRCNNLIQVVYLFCIILFCFHPGLQLVLWLALFCWLRIFVNSKFSILSLLSCPYRAFLLIAYFVIQFWGELYFLFILLPTLSNPGVLHLLLKLRLCRPKRSWVWTLEVHRQIHRDFHIPYHDT